MRSVFYFATLCLAIGTVACSSNPPAPVIDRLPSSKSSTVNASNIKKNTASTRPTYKPGDWRPDTYVVKKGDNLFSIGLEHGYYYKDIAQANSITAPYHIQAGQLLSFKALKDKNTVKDNKSVANNTDGVEITPINANSGASGVTTSDIAQTQPTIIAITEPKATRETYSDEAFKKPLVIAKPPTEKPVVIVSTQKPTATNPPEAANKPKPESKSTAESPEDIDWAWPTKGKVIANFNEGSNKGIDIAGSNGQAVNAAATGKVIYSGSDLRGYGKLVIIKHNATYLSVYAHNSQILVKEGQQVTRDQKIAEMGNTDSNSVKLHFEIRRQGKSVDPSKYLAVN